MSLADYEQFVFAAGHLDAGDPVAFWRSFGAELQQAAEFLGRVSELRVLAPDTDLTVGVQGRSWVAADGKHDFPDGEVFTGPVEDAVEGEIRFSYPAI